ncbi:MAG: hypothetical protein SFY95_09670 [Planctomycetota bacterium]|nr:hypothetical protein [Planctomycetota bacterium]
MAEPLVSDQSPACDHPRACGSPKLRRSLRRTGDMDCLWMPMGTHR